MATRRPVAIVGGALQEITDSDSLPSALSLDSLAMHYKGAWAQQANAVGDVVTRNNKLYVCNTATTAGATFPSAQFTEIASDIQFADIQFYAVTTTWTKPANASTVEVVCIGAGAGGASGASGAAATNRSGGNGGGAGALSQATFRASDLTATVVASVGTGGAGAVGTAGGASTLGAVGGDTTFGTYLKAQGGLTANTNINEAGVTVPWPWTAKGTNSAGRLNVAWSNTGPNPPVVLDSPTAAPGNGGSGSGATTANVAVPGTVGSAGGGGATAGGTRSSDGSVPTAGGVGGTGAAVLAGGGGGGGGCTGGAAASGAGSNGGAGGSYGGGGGGGGAAVSTVKGGNGGLGAPGCCLVITRY